MHDSMVVCLRIKLVKLEIRSNRAELGVDIQNLDPGIYKLFIGGNGNGDGVVVGNTTQAFFTAWQHGMPYR